MSLDNAFLIAAFLIVSGFLVGVTLDRMARAKAWRQIAEERRWNHDRRHSDLDGV